MKAFEIDPNENPMFTALRMYDEDLRVVNDKVMQLKEIWPDIMRADRGAKPWDEMSPDILEVLARRIF